MLRIDPTSLGRTLLDAAKLVSLLNPSRFALPGPGISNHSNSSYPDRSRAEPKADPDAEKLVNGKDGDPTPNERGRKSVVPPSERGISVRGESRLRLRYNPRPLALGDVASDRGVKERKVLPLTLPFGMPTERSSALPTLAHPGRSAPCWIVKSSVGGPSLSIAPAETFKVAVDRGRIEGSAGDDARGDAGSGVSLWMEESDGRTQEDAATLRV